MGRLVDKADFERLLASRSCARSPHFALHHVAVPPHARIERPARRQAAKLSTDPAPICPQPVDESSVGCWLGCVVPKRHARRAVTRNLLKRQVRSAFDRHAATLAHGLWLVRLRSPFATTDFVSARSAKLALAARLELDGLLQRVAA